MNRRSFYLLTAVIFLCLMNSACSWVTQFAIVNKSGEPIEIRLKYAPLSGERNLMKTNLDEKGNIINENWQKFAPEDFQDNKVDEIVTLKLAANEAVAVASDVTYTGHKSNDTDFFKVKELGIKGARGAIHLEDEQVLMQFREEKETLYTIIYQ